MNNVPIKHGMKAFQAVVSFEKTRSHFKTSLELILRSFVKKRLAKGRAKS